MVTTIKITCDGVFIQSNAYNHHIHQAVVDRNNNDVVYKNGAYFLNQVLFLLLVLSCVFFPHWAFMWHMRFLASDFFLPWCHIQKFFYFLKSLSATERYRWLSHVRLWLRGSANRPASLAVATWCWSDHIYFLFRKGLFPQSLFRYTIYLQFVRVHSTIESTELGYINKINLD